MSLRSNANFIINEAISRVLPDEAVKKAINQKLSQGGFGEGKIILVAIGKAGWQMAKAAVDILGDLINGGICLTKYEHVRGQIPKVKCYEAGHPVPDENSYKATKEIIKMVDNLSKEDTVIFLISGGGSSLFEKPLVNEWEIADITSQLLASGANISEINTIRKRLSAVKGGKFAKLIEPASVFSIVLSDIVGDPLDMIASGPAYPDSASSKQACEIIRKYNIRLSKEAEDLMMIETPKELVNVETMITGSVKDLCNGAAAACGKLGYETIILTDQMTCEAREAGSFMASIARTHVNESRKRAYIAGGESVVHLKGSGKGGRNQELALAGAEGLKGLRNVCLFSVGSDGTDGPTDAAGGYVDGNTAGVLESMGIKIFDVLMQNDAYNALKKTNGLIMTGATGTNVNDFTVLLID